METLACTIACNNQDCIFSGCHMLCTWSQVHRNTRSVKVFKGSRLALSLLASRN